MNKTNRFDSKVSEVEHGDSRVDPGGIKFEDTGSLSTSRIISSILTLRCVLRVRAHSNVEGPVVSMASSVTQKAFRKIVPLKDL